MHFLGKALKGLVVLWTVWDRENCKSKGRYSIVSREKVSSRDATDSKVLVCPEDVTVRSLICRRNARRGAGLICRIRNKRVA